MASLLGINPSLAVMTYYQNVVAGSVKSAARKVVLEKESLGYIIPAFKHLMPYEEVRHVLSRVQTMNSIGVATKWQPLRLKNEANGEVQKTVHAVH